MIELNNFCYIMNNSCIVIPDANELEDFWMDHFLGKVNTSIATYWWVMIGLLQLMKITFQHWNHRTFPKSTKKCIKSVLFLCEEAYVIVACSNKNTSRSAKLSISLCIDRSISCMHANMQISVYLVDLLFARPLATTSIYDLLFLDNL
jgi:hypothetical protein